jgi:hypothetical protein
MHQKAWPLQGAHQPNGGSKVDGNRKMQGMKTGGRKKGTPNKRSAELIKAMKSGESPLDYMLRVMRDSRAAPERRDQMAKAAAPYMHPRLTAIEVSDNDESSYQASVSIHVTFVDPKAEEGEAAPSKLLA